MRPTCHPRTLDGITVGRGLSVDPIQGLVSPILTYLELVQTPGEAEGLWIRTDPVSGQRQLLIGNTVGGIRVLEYSF